MPYKYELMRDANDVVVTTMHVTPYCGELVHNCLEFMYVENGYVCFGINGRKHYAGAGQMVAIASFTPHWSRVLERGEIYLVLVPRRMVGCYDSLLDGNTFADPVMTDSEQIALGAVKLMYRINGEAPFKSDNSPERCELLGHLARFLTSAAINSCGLVPNRCSTKDISDAVIYIDRHFREPIGTADIAKALFMNQQTLSESFRETFGLSVKKYISHVRTVEVARLIQSDPGMTLSEAADLAGYQSMRSMLRDFNEEFGCTPTEYRRQRGDDLLDRMLYQPFDINLMRKGRKQNESN